MKLFPHGTYQNKLVFKQQRFTLELYIQNMSNPQLATQYKNKGNDAFKAQRYEEAIDYFTKAIQNNPNDHVFYSNRSGAYLNHGDYDQALQDAETCVKMNPNWPRGYQRKGTAYFYKGEIDEAINTYKEGLKVDPSNADLQKDLKSAENKKNQPEESPQLNQAYLQSMIKLMSNPQTKDFINDPSFMQKVQLIMKNPQLAQTLIQQDPKLAKAYEVISSDSGPNDLEGLKKMFEKANFAGKKQPEKKQETYSPPPKPEPKKEQKKPEKMQPEDPSEALKNRGNQQFKKKNFNEALNFYEEAIQANPNEPLYYNNKAATYIELKQYDNALGEIGRAEKLFEEGVVKDFIKKAKVLARKGTIYSKLQRYDDSIAAFEKSLVEDMNQKVKDELGKVRKLKKQKQARQYINPALGQQHCEKGNNLYKQGKFPPALKEYEEAIKRNPQVAKYYSNLGQVYIKLMEFQRAKENYEIAIKKDPNFVKAYPKKGDCHFFLKEYHKALQAYQFGLKLDPNNALCKAGIQKTQASIYLNNSQEDQEERAKRAMADPEIQAIMRTPEVRNALAELQRNPKALQSILQDRNIAQKLQKLIAAGILKIG